ncbi:Glycosyltransferase involved in cell wall bisynthesis [Lachnospiraceae bacterium G11]|nr:Glycosyltransferase involved in cell wall bisynthesis [Lachnospiraceae bacterium G11]
MLGHKRIPSREGGVEIVVKELAIGLAARGCDVTCYNRGGHHVSGKEFDSFNPDECKDITIKTAWTIDLKGLAAVTSSFFGSIACAFGKYDLIHFHAEGPAFMCWLPKKLGKKIVVTIHGLDWKRAKWGRFASWYIMQGERAAAKYADEMIVLSKAVQDYFKEKYNRDTIFIPNGVTILPQIASEIVKYKYNLEKDEYILFLGRLVPEKGVHYLIEAFKGLETDKKLVIAGGSSDTFEYMNELKQMAEGDERIIFTGFVEGKELEELYSNAYLYVLPSDVEGMPLSLLEAMSYGKACLVSDIPECAGVIKDKEMLFEHGDVNALRMKLSELLKDSDMVREHADKAFRTVSEEYSWDKCIEQTLEVYNRVLETK